MTAYHLEVTRLPVKVAVVGGEPFAGGFFLHRVGDHRPGEETLGERLNRPGTRFLPFEVAGAVELVSLASVAYVEHVGALPEVTAHGELGGRREPVRIRLRSGEELEGELLYLFTGSGARVQDRLNAGSDRFLLLVSGETARYVNVDAVLSLRS
jgi:hypothetical protein